MTKKKGEDVLTVTKAFIDYEMAVVSKPDGRKAILDELYEMLKNKSLLDVYFLEADKIAKELRGVYKGIMIIMHYSDLYGDEKGPVEYMNAFVGKTVKVMIKYVDYDKEQVNVSYNSARSHIKDRLVNDITKHLEIGKNPVVIAKVQGYDHKQKQFVLEIGGVKLLGYINRTEWSYCMSSNFVKEGSDYRGKGIKVAILSYHPRVIDKKTGQCTRAHVICSKKQLMPDPWIPLQGRIHHGDAVVVTCKNRKASKAGFFSTLDLDNEIETFTFFDDVPEGVQIIEGVKYKGFIKRINYDKRKMIFIPEKIAVVNQGEMYGGY